VAEKKASTIVIKKITIAGGGAHGGAWKVAFADFMTAMMCFFLVMWLLSTSSEASKKQVSDYFSTPSIIEYEFSNYGVELTLEKLFLDITNDPLKALQDFLKPMDPHPNIMAMGMKKVIMAYMAEEMGDMVKSVDITPNSVSFEIKDNFLFEKGTANIATTFPSNMERIKNIVIGIEDADVTITSQIYVESVRGGDIGLAKNVAAERYDIIGKKIKASISHDTVEMHPGRIKAEHDTRKGSDNLPSGGSIKFEMKQKTALADGKNPRPIQDDAFGKAKADESVYDNFVQQLVDRKKKKKQ
jgi:chemotaxis protein MotB